MIAKFVFFDHLLSEGTWWRDNRRISACGQEALPCTMTTEIDRLV